jgi:hypothetical protein
MVKTNNYDSAVKELEAKGLSKLAPKEVAKNEANQNICVHVSNINKPAEGRYEYVGKVVKYNDSVFDMVKKSSEGPSLVLVHKALSYLDYKALLAEDEDESEDDAPVKKKKKTGSNA